MDDIKEAIDFRVNTQKPIFSIDTASIVIRGDDVQVGASQLLKCVYPNSLGDDTDNRLYNLLSANEQTAKNVSVNYSKEITAAGRPLYAEVKIEFV